MYTPADFVLDTTISFDMHAPAVLGATVSRVKITGILDYDTARLYVNDIQALHNRIWPDLPAGTPNDPTKYKYIKVIRADGTPWAYGIPWIVDGSISTVNGTSMQITLDNLTQAQQNTVINVLSRAGFAAMSVTYPTSAAAAGTASGSSFIASGS